MLVKGNLCSASQMSMFAGALWFQLDKPTTPVSKVPTPTSSATPGPSAGPKPPIPASAGGSKPPLGQYAAPSPHIAHTYICIAGGCVWGLSSHGNTPSGGCGWDVSNEDHLVMLFFVALCPNVKLLRIRKEICYTPTSSEEKESCLCHTVCDSRWLWCDHLLFGDAESFGLLQRL